VELFAGTISENIARLGEVDSEKVIEAAKKAGVHDLILHLPQGYDTPIGGEAGQVLSGGQRQRMGLARALYGAPRFVVLDEPNSNLDDAGEKALMKTLDQLKKDGTTTIVVSHKPSLLSNVDKVLMMKAGQVAMFGPRQQVFQALMEGGGQPSQPRPAANVRPMINK
jgi:ABC-type protease/lipase transport system fused ATPase/permease subunit